MNYTLQDSSCALKAGTQRNEFISDPTPGLFPYPNGGYCPAAMELHQAERAAMLAYRAAGGVLPAL